MIITKFGVRRGTGTEGLCIGNGSNGSDMAGSIVDEVDNIFACLERLEVRGDVGEKVCLETRPAI